MSKEYLLGPASAAYYPPPPAPTLYAYETELAVLRVHRQNPGNSWGIGLVCAALGLAPSGIGCFIELVKGQQASLIDYLGLVFCPTCLCSGVIALFLVKQRVDMFQETIANIANRPAVSGPLVNPATAGTPLPSAQAS